MHVKNKLSSIMLICSYILGILCIIVYALKAKSSKLVNMRVNIFTDKAITCKKDTFMDKGLDLCALIFTKIIVGFCHKRF